MYTPETATASAAAPSSTEESAHASWSESIGALYIYE